jgi:Skp family chaperone for outer membrane proteins
MASWLIYEHTQERLALESMRKEFENELHAARSEVAKAQEALAASEERIRATEQLERARLEADYQGRLAAMGAEVVSLIHLLASSTLW